MGSLEKRLGSQVAYHRKLARVTQAELAERVNVAPETISRLERGAAMPSLGRLEQVATALGRDLYELFQGEKQSVRRDARALDRLVACVRTNMLTTEDIDLVTELAAQIFRHMNRTLDKRNRRRR